MQFVIKTKYFGALNESPQTNSLRFTILKEIAANTFNVQGPVMKCTDYLNDVVAKHHNSKNVFSVYGFTNQVEFEADGGLFVLFEHITDTFEHNVAIINEQLTKDFNCGIMVSKDDDNTRVILYFPKEVFRSTYVMSLLMWVLRLSNYGLAFKSWNDIWDNNASPANGCESHAKGDRAKREFRARGFGVPDDYLKYWWFQGANYNSEKEPKPQGTLIHNCGCAAWWSYMI